MGDLVTLTNGIYSLTIDPDTGARITAFRINDKNCLTTSAPETGSTFWPSPQHFWDWPPPPVLDKQPYEVHQQDNGWEFKSSPCSITGLVISKVVRPASKGFELTYKMHNPSERVLRYAPWEITRIDGGITFYRSTSSPLAHSTLPILALGNSFWYDYQPAGVDRNLKLFANGSEGWLANTCYGLLLKKTFEAVPLDKVAPLEAEVEIYAHGDADNAYIEIEQQGCFSAIEPGSTVEWKVLWQLIELPESTLVEVGSAELLALAEAM